MNEIERARTIAADVADLANSYIDLKERHDELRIAAATVVLMDDHNEIQAHPSADWDVVGSALDDLKKALKK